MELNYRLELADYQAFARHFTLQSHLWIWNERILAILFFGLIPLGCLVAAALVAMPPLSDYEAAAVLAVFAVSSCAVWWCVQHWILQKVHHTLLDWYLRWFVQHQGAQGVLGEIRLILTEDTLTEITETTTTTARWQSIHRLDEAPEHFYIYVTSFAAAIVPRRAFASPAEYDAAREFAKMCLARAGRGMT